MVPYDVRIPKVRISTHLTEELRNYRYGPCVLYMYKYCARPLTPSPSPFIGRILIRVDGWEEGSQYPHGHFVCSLGPIGDTETETKAILITHGLLSQPFTKAQVG